MYVFEDMRPIILFLTLSASICRAGLGTLCGETATVLDTNADGMFSCYILPVRTSTCVYYSKTISVGQWKQADEFFCLIIIRKPAQRKQLPPIVEFVDLAHPPACLSAYVIRRVDTTRFNPVAL